MLDPSLDVVMCSCGAAATGGLVHIPAYLTLGFLEVKCYLTLGFLEVKCYLTLGFLEVKCYMAKHSQTQRKLNPHESHCQCHF